MADITFDDLIPKNGTAPGGGGLSFDDLIPTTPDQLRQQRLRKMAAAAMQNMEGEPGAEDLYKHNAMLGLGKPVTGLAEALGGEVRELFGSGEPASFGERYGAGVGAYQDRLDAARKNSGWGGTAAELAGSVTAPVGGARTALGTLASALGLGAVEGAANRSESLPEAATGALQGGLTAGATTGALQAAGALARNVPTRSWRARRAAERQAARGPDPAAIRAEAGRMFDQLREGGVAYDVNQANDLVDNVMNGLRGYDPEGVHAPLRGVLGRVEELRGRPLQLEQLMAIREQLGSNAQAIEPQVRRIANEAMGGIEGYIQHNQPAMSLNMPPEEVGPLWARARDLWRTQILADDMGWRLDKATNRSARTNSGSNIENPIRQNVGAVLDKATQPRRYNPYNPAEIAQMERVSEGTGPQNVLRYWGNKFGGSGPLGSVANYGGGGGLGLASMVSGAEPSTAGMIALAGAGALRGTGLAARAASNRIAENEADALVRLISTGSAAPIPQYRPIGPPTRDALARQMRERMLQALQRGGGLFTAGEVTQP